MPLVAWARLSRSAIPPGHTIGRLPRPLSTKGDAVFSDSVTVRASSSASAVAPTGMKVPRKGLWFFASVTKFRLSATSVAVSSSPSAQVIPSARVSVTVLPSTVQSSASCEAISPVSPSTLTSVS